MQLVSKKNRQDRKGFQFVFKEYFIQGLKTSA